MAMSTCSVRWRAGSPTSAPLGMYARVAPRKARYSQVRRIVIAENEPMIRATISEYLNDEGFEVVLATNGAEALQYARKTPPDVAVIDVMMPAWVAERCWSAGRKKPCYRRFRSS
jgi:PleD family two-component response regulator